MLQILPTSPTLTPRASDAAIHQAPPYVIQTQPSVLMYRQYKHTLVHQHQNNRMSSEVERVNQIHKFLSESHLLLKHHLWGSRHLSFFRPVQFFSPQQTKSCDIDPNFLSSCFPLRSSEGDHVSMCLSLWHDNLNKYPVVRGAPFFSTLVVRTCLGLSLKFLLVCDVTCFQFCF